MHDASEPEIGGYLDLSANAPARGVPHLALNAGRFCLEYIIRAREYDRIALPCYGCHTLTAAARNTGAEIVYYTLDESFLPELSAQDTPVLYINYYGMMMQKCAELAGKFPNLIIDNAQAFYAKPLPGHDCFYSPRKFFALPDGGYIVAGRPLQEFNLPTDVSYDRIEHLVRRVDCGAENAYAVNIENRDKIASAGMKRMSLLTRLMLGQVDTASAAVIRRSNWKLLNDELSPYNELKISLNKDDVPLFYPFVLVNDKLRSHLNGRKIFTAQYWPGVDNLVQKNSFDAHLFHYMHPLPLDQRYAAEHMARIVKIIKKFLT